MAQQNTTKITDLTGRVVPPSSMVETLGPREFFKRLECPMVIESSTLAGSQKSRWRALLPAAGLKLPERSSAVRISVSAFSREAAEYRLARLVSGKSIEVNMLGGANPVVHSLPIFLRAPKDRLERKTIMSHNHAARQLVWLKEGRENAAPSERPDHSEFVNSFRRDHGETAASQLQRKIELAVAQGQPVLHARFKYEVLAPYQARYPSLFWLTNLPWVGQYFRRIVLRPSLGRVLAKIRTTT